MAGSGVLEQMRRVPRRIGKRTRSGNYNYPKEWYLRVDGQVVELDGDPDAVAHYTRKGYQVLTGEALDDWLGPVVDRRGTRDVAASVRYEEMVAGLRRATLITEIRQLLALPSAKDKVTLQGINVHAMDEDTLKRLLDDVKKAVGMERTVLDAKALGYDFALEDLDSPEALGLVTEEDLLDVAEAQARGGAELGDKLRRSRAQGNRVISSAGPPLDG